MRSAVHALAAQIENPEIELGADVAGRGGLLEEFDGSAVVARRAGQALGVDQRKPMGAFARAGVGGVLDVAQSFAVGAAVEQDGAQPGLGVGVARRERAKCGLGGRRDRRRDRPSTAERKAGATSAASTCWPRATPLTASSAASSATRSAIISS